MTRVPEAGQELEAHRDEEDEEQPDPEARHRLTQQSEELGSPVDPAPAVHRRQHAERHGEEQREDQTGEGQLEGRGQAAQKELHRWRVPQVRLAEVAM